jgi:ABC-type polar amino acid transport system ATPase subunit
MNQRGITVELQDVSKHYGDRVVLDGVSLVARPSETVALIGPSGGGKSTLLRCINGLQPFDRGQIAVGPHRLYANGQNGSKRSAAQIRGLVGMVFQDFQLFGHLTALANVTEAPRRVLGLSRQEANDRGRALLARVGLADRAEALPHQLSGGQKQRVAIARALAMEPRALLCDEVTSALDPELKSEVLDVLEGLRGDGLTLLLVTHEIGFARRAADRVAVLDQGRVIEEGTPAEVLDHPRLPRTRQFLNSVMA